MKKFALLSLTALLTLTACGTKTTPSDEKVENSVIPFMETAKTAKAMGGSLEWNKMEGLAYDAQSRTLYIAVTSFLGGMSDGKGDIQFPANKCGGIVAAQLDSSLNATKLTPILVGKPTDKGCDVSGLNSPDNIFLDKKGRLWIGEDGDDTRNTLWAYDLRTKGLKRFAVVPNGGEVTGLRVSEQGDLFLNIQHPEKDNAAPYDKGTVGVVSGFNANADDFAELAYDGTPLKELKVATGKYNVLGRAGEQGLGVIKNADGSSVTSNNPDANMLISTGADTGVLYTHWETRPGGISRLDMKREGGVWKASNPSMVDMSSVNGTWVNCNGSVTSWGSALTSEEYPTETDAEWAKYEPVMSKHLGKKANRYDYGYVSEITPSGAGQTIQKHYAMGRTSFEMALVLNDDKTVYYGDDGDMRGMYKFVADKARDLSAGTLYVAKLTQVDDAGSANGKSLNVSWIKLGHGTDKEIGEAIRRLD